MYNLNFYKTTVIKPQILYISKCIACPIAYIYKYATIKIQQFIFRYTFMDNNIFGRTSRMKITYMLLENVIYIYKSWFSIFSSLSLSPFPAQCNMVIHRKDIRSNGGVFGFRCYVEKNIHDIANTKSNAKIRNPPTLYNKTILTLIPHTPSI